ncbi:MAG: hypothetical protein AAB795_00720 [Patescibacteria group bacterium]
MKNSASKTSGSRPANILEVMKELVILMDKNGYTAKGTRGGGICLVPSRKCTKSKKKK